jgi:predicted metal-dependent peptidase
MFLAYIASSKYKKSKSAFSRVISQLRRVPAPGVGTMGVTIRDGAYVLMYDPEFLADEALTADDIALVLEHEFLHLLLNHIPRFSRAHRNAQSDYEKFLISRMANIAMDYADNSLMVKLGSCTVDDLKGLGGGKYAGIYPTDVGLPPYKSMEYYLKVMLKDPDKYIKQIIDVVLVDSDSECDQTGALPDNVELNIVEDRRTKPSDSGEEDSPSEGLSEQQKRDALDAYTARSNQKIHDDISEQLDKASPEDSAQIEQDLERSAKSTIGKVLEKEKSRGTLSGDLISLIDEFLKEPEIPWQALLRQFINNTRRFSKKTSLRYPKRRLLIDEVDPLSEPCEFPGRVRNPAWTITFILDTSGSMSDTEINECLRELKGIQSSDQNILIHVLEADTEVKKEYLLDPQTKIDREVKGRRGTDFNQPLARAIELDSDIVIYATDGEAPLPRRENRVPDHKILWLVTSQGCYPGNYSYYHRSEKERRTPKERYGKAIFLAAR